MLAVTSQDLSSIRTVGVPELNTPVKTTDSPPFSDPNRGEIESRYEVEDWSYVTAFSPSNVIVVPSTFKITGHYVEVAVSASTSRPISLTSPTRHEPTSSP